MRAVPPEMRRELQDTLREVQQTRRELCEPQADSLPTRPVPHTPPRSPQTPLHTRPQPMPPGWHPPMAPPGQPPQGGPQPMPPGWHPPMAPTAGHPGAGAGGTSPPQTMPGTGGNASVQPRRFDALNDPIVDTAKWWKEGLFAVRAYGRVPVEGWGGLPKGTSLPDGSAALRWGNFTKLVGLGGFSIAANVQKGREVYSYWTSGDPGDKWRAAASGSEFMNNIRLGITGITPLLKDGARFTNFAKSYMGGVFGTGLGVGANAAAGTFKVVGIWTDYNTDMAVAATPRQKDQALYTAEEKTLGTVIDTASDIYPYVAGMEPLGWASWLTGKLADHGAQAALKGSGYEAVSFGAEKARNLMPLAAAVGLAPDVPLRDLAQPLSADQRLVAEFDNSIHRTAGVATGVTEIGITATEGVVAGYFSGGNPSVIYATWQVDHALRQGANVWTDLYWQRPAERSAAVASAGLDPKLDTRMVVHEQKDFLHRLWAGATADFKAGYIDGKQDFGSATMRESRWLELDKQYTAPNISTDSPRTPDAWYVQAFSPTNLWNTVTLTNPALTGFKALDARNIGTASAYVEQGWKTGTEAIGDAWSATSKTATYVLNHPVEAAVQAGDATYNTAKSLWNGTSSTISKAWDWAWGR
jgi:hypothetical protein